MKAFVYLFSILVFENIISTSEAVKASAEVLEFTKGNLLFTANLYKEIATTNRSSFIVSSFSIEVVLALTNEGALGETSEELQKGLSLPSSKEVTQQALKVLLSDFTYSKELSKLLPANKIYTANSVKLTQNFSQIATNIYQSEVENINFADKQQAVQTMNKWVEEHTNNKIQNLFHLEDAGAFTKIILVNCLYFSGQWQTPFQEYDTTKDIFYVTRDDIREVDMMHRTDYYRYYENTKLNTKFVKLRYEETDVSFVIALPNEIDGLSKLENVEELLQPQSFAYKRIDLKIPKFKIESEIPLNDILEKMGIRKIFTFEANLSGMTSTHSNGLFVDKIAQKAFLELNENGTEAAAAGDVIITESIPPLLKIYFKADHPYLFYITKSNVILFVGRYGY